MSTPPSENNPPDELIQAYRRASATDRNRPSQRVRDAILARASQIVSGKSVADQRSRASATPLVSQAQWKWKAAASLAAVGLTGLLAFQTFRTTPRGPTPADTASTSVEAQQPGETAPVASSSSPELAPPPPAVKNEASRDRGRSSVTNVANPRHHEMPAPPTDTAGAAAELAPQAQFGEQAARTEAPAAREKLPVSAMASRAASPLFSTSRDKAIAAARATFPELFNESAVTGTVRIALVLNSDGTVFKSAREEFAVTDQMSAAAQLSKALGIDADELQGLADIVVLDKTSDQPDTIVIAFGVRRSNLGTTEGARP